MKVSSGANNNQEHNIGHLKRALTTKLYLCCMASYPVVSRLFYGNSHNAPEGIKLIESIYPKNNNYLLMDRAYEDDKTIALAKAYVFRAVVPPKKNRKSTWLCDKQRNIIERYLLK